VYFNLYVFGQQTGIQNILNRMVEALTGFSLLLIPDACSQHVQLKNPYITSNIV